MRDFKSFLYRCLYAVIILCIRKILPIIFYCPFAFGNRLFLNMHLVGKQHSDLFLLVFHWLFLEKVRDYVRTVRTQNQEKILHFFTLDISTYIWDFKMNLYFSSKKLKRLSNRFEVLLLQLPCWKSRPIPNDLKQKKNFDWFKKNSCSISDWRF